MTKRKAAIVAAFLALAGGVGLYLGKVPRACTIAEVWASCSFLEQHAPALAPGCVDGRQVEVVVTAPASELTGTAEEIIDAMAEQAGVEPGRALRYLRHHLTLITVDSRTGTGAQCPAQRLKLRTPTSGCIGGLVSDGETTRWGQCCGPTCSCAGACCATVGRTELAGSGQMRRTICETCPQLEECI